MCLALNAICVPILWNCKGGDPLCALFHSSFLLRRPLMSALESTWAKLEFVMRRVYTERNRDLSLADHMLHKT